MQESQVELFSSQVHVSVPLGGAAVVVGTAVVVKAEHVTKGIELPNSEQLTLGL